MAEWTLYVTANLPKWLVQFYQSQVFLRTFQASHGFEVFIGHTKTFKHILKLLGNALSVNGLACFIIVLLCSWCFEYSYVFF